MTEGQNKLNKLYRHLSSDEISDYAGNKKNYENTSRVFLKQLLGDISKLLLKHGITVAESKISYSHGGPEEAGDPSLYFMMDNGGGIAVRIISLKGSNPLVYRSITSLRDHVGSVSKWVPATKPYESIVAEIADFALV